MRWRGPALAAYLAAFVAWSAIPIGSMAWLMIHRLTGGRWGVAAAPVLRLAASIMPLSILAFLPPVVGFQQIYPWAADPAQIPHDVARWYLNGALFALRSCIALAGWTLLGLVFAAGLGSRLLAGLGLAFFGLTVSLAAVDWYLSLEPHYVASAFAATIAIQQLLAALALTAVLAPPQIEGNVAGDIGGLLIATLLGVKEPDRCELEELYEIREPLERYAARRAAAAISPEGIAELQRLCAASHRSAPAN